MCFLDGFSILLVGRFVMQCLNVVTMYFDLQDMFCFSVFFVLFALFNSELIGFLVIALATTSALLTSSTHVECRLAQKLVRL